jgi:hypothetical protein
MHDLGQAGGRVRAAVLSVADGAVTSRQSPGLSGPCQASAPAASARVCVKELDISIFPPPGTRTSMPGGTGRSHG